MVTSSSGIKVWDWVNGTERFNLSSHHGEVNSVAFSSDGDQMVTGSWDYTAKLWAANLKIETLRLKQLEVPNMEANYSPDGKWIVTVGSNGQVLVYNASTGDVVNDGLYGFSASFDPQDSQRVVTVDGNALVWTLGQDEPFAIGGDETFDLAIFSPDGGTILASSFNGTKLWDSRSGDLLLDLGTGTSDAQFSPDGKWIAASSGNYAQMWDAKTGEWVGDLVGHTDNVLAVAFSHDGKYIYTGSYDNTIRKWNAETGEVLLVMTGHTGRVFDLDVSPDGALVASASADATVRVWDAETGKEIYTYRGNSGDANSVAFSPDGKKVLTASDDKITKEFTIDFKTLLQIAQQYELRQLTREECRRYLKRENCTLRLANAVTAPLGQPGSPDSGPDTAPSVQSGDGDTPVTLIVENNTSFEVNVFWVDFDGVEQYYFSAAPGDIIEQGTYNMHVWRVRDTDGNFVMDYIVTDDPKQTLEITGEAVSSGAQPEVETPADVPSSASGSGGAFYTEEFDGNLDAWREFMVSGTENQVDTFADNGSLFVRLSPDEDKIPRFYLVNDDSDYSSVQMEAVTTNNGNNSNGVSLVCNYDGANWYEFTISNAGLYSINAYDPAATAVQGYVQLATGGSVAIKSGPTTNVYRAVCNGSELTLYINDTLVKTLVDTKYNLTGGKIGIGVSSPQTLPVDVSFESLTISEP
jgi:WD40 repeat protein